MSKLMNLEFGTLDISGDNYLALVLNAEIYLDSKDLLDTIKDGNQTQSKEKLEAIIFLRYHLHKDPQIIWNNLKHNYDHEKTMILSKVRYDWTHLRLQDFKYTQYGEKGFVKYSQLISCLLVAEKNNELLLKNHGLRPSGSAPFPEANVTSYGQESGYNRGRGRGHDCGRGRGRGRGYTGGRGSGVHFKNSNSHKKWENKDGNKQVKIPYANICYRCGAKDHWSRTCRTPKHLVELYQQSVKGKGKDVETNLVNEDGEDDFDLDDFTHLDIDDFLPVEETK